MIHLIRKLDFSQGVSGSQNDITHENASHTCSSHSLPDAHYVGFLVLHL